jgi:ribonuclease P protein component
MRVVPRAASAWQSEAVGLARPGVVGIVIARLVRSADFERVLRTRTRMSSAHFAVHHVAEPPQIVSRRTKTANSAELSTGSAPGNQQAVDDLECCTPEQPWLGVVVPKRHAKRSVTRTLLKRQIRAVAAGLSGRLPAGLWVVRLRAPFDKLRFASAASDDLRAVARSELEGLFDGAVKRVAAGA